MTMNQTRKVVLRFPQDTADRPLVCELALRFGLVFNILRASISPHREGLMVLELFGDTGKQEMGLHFLRDKGVEIEDLSQDIRKNDNRCFHCGACVGVCPSGALYVDRQDYRVYFDENRCIACEFCVQCCPTHAMEALI